jgi:hypothetical protein
MPKSVSRRRFLEQGASTNIAHVYGFESATLADGSSSHFLAMDLVEGEDLAERLKRGAACSRWRSSAPERAGRPRCFLADALA